MKRSILDKKRYIMEAHNRMEKQWLLDKNLIKEELPTTEIDPRQFPNPLPDEFDSFFKIKGKYDKNETDDKVSVKAVDIPATDLYPSQSAIFLGKSLGMAIGGVTGGKLDAIISKDNRILDGHHRWAATMFNDPSATIKGYQADLGIGDLIPVMRAMGDAYGNTRRGEPSGGDINIYKATIENALNSLQTGANMDPKYYNKDKALGWLEKIGGEKVLKQRLKNIQAHTMPSGAPSRDNMPVIDADKGQHFDVAKKLIGGDLDVKPPYQQYAARPKVK
jgi:hypothetical protein